MTLADLDSAPQIDTIASYPKPIDPCPCAEFMIGPLLGPMCTDAFVCQTIRCGPETSPVSEKSVELSRSFLSLPLQFGCQYLGIGSANRET